MALTKIGKEGITGIDNSSNATAITIDSSENVAMVGTLDVTGELNTGTNIILNSPPSSTSDNISVRITGGTAGYSNVQFADADDVNVGMIQYNHSSNYMQFTTSDNERMRISSGGNVSVGGTNATARLNAIAANWPENAIGVYSANIAGQTNFAGIAFFNQDTDSTTGNVADIYTNPTGTLSLTSASNPAIQLKYGSSGISGGTAALTVDSSGNVGIGTSSPNEKLTVSSGAISFLGDISTPSIGAGLFRPANNTLAVVTGSTERMRIDSSGNVLIGKTSASTSTEGIELRANDDVVITQSSGTCLFLNRLSTDGNILSFDSDNSGVGSIGTSSSDLYIGTGDAGFRFQDGSNSIVPFNTSTGAVSDNLLDLGGGSSRFDDIFATNGTIQTSDKNEKQDIEELSEAEQRVAVVAKGLMRKFRWIDSVAEKGDNARTHFGIIAQDLQDAFTAEGLDAGDYAMFISNTWWELDGETYDIEEEAPEGATQRTRLGVRYNQLLAFIISAI